MKQRKTWLGVWNIVRFNWPLYVAALGTAGLATVTSLTVNSPIAYWLSLAALCGSAYFISVSLLVSHLVYDRSDLYHWLWIKRIFSKCQKPHAILCHSGFDEISEPLEQTCTEATWTLLDHFDPAHMTEKSILRARMALPPRPVTLPAAYDHWPVKEHTADLVLGILAIHEFRTEAERAAWFHQARKSLKADGRIIIAEHVRDLANFIAFGPGFVHFHSTSSWRRSWEAAGLSLTDTFRITPWVRVFILTA
jgi:hypothetical protein